MKTLWKALAVTGWTAAALAAAVTQKTWLVNLTVFLVALQALGSILLLLSKEARDKAMEDFRKQPWLMHLCRGSAWLLIVAFAAQGWFWLASAQFLRMMVLQCDADETKPDAGKRAVHSEDELASARDTLRSSQVPPAPGDLGSNESRASRVAYLPPSRP